MTKEYVEFYGNAQDILNGCSDVSRTIELFEQLFTSYRTNIPVMQVVDDTVLIPINLGAKTILSPKVF
jgi:hypothetical protein